LAGVCLWRGDCGPFIRHAQLKSSHRLIVVPLSTFHRLAEQIGDPQLPLIFSFHTTRCGSTLLVQVRHSGRTLASVEITGNIGQCIVQTSWEMNTFIRQKSVMERLKTTDKNIKQIKQYNISSYDRQSTQTARTQH